MPFGNTGLFGTRQQAYLDLLAARAALGSGTQNGQGALRWNLTGFQAQRDAVDRANLFATTDSLPAMQERARAAVQSARPGLTGITGAVPSLGLAVGGLSEFTAPRGASVSRTPLAANLLAMPTLEQVSGGKAVDPAAFIAGRSGVVDACRKSITGHLRSTVDSGGRPGEAGRCLDTPVGLSYREGPAFDPQRFRSSLDALATKPPEALVQRHRENQDRAAAPPAPPRLPEELTRSISPCRRFDHAADEATEWLPPLAPVTNAIEHLCLLAFK